MNEHAHSNCLAGSFADSADYSALVHPRNLYLVKQGNCDKHYCNSYEKVVMAHPH